MLSGIHHVKLPVTDVVRSRDWYADVLGFESVIDFVEDGELMGVAMRRSDCPPQIALRHDPRRAQAMSGLDAVALLVPEPEQVHSWAAELDRRGEPHGGVVTGHRGGTVLVGLHDPDGTEIRLYADPMTSPDSATSAGHTATAIASMHAMGTGSLEDLAAVFTEDAINREAENEPPEARGVGPAAMHATARWLRSAFSELAWDIHDVVSDGDLVVVHATMSGRQTGPFIAYAPDAQIKAVFPPRGRRFAVTQTHWFRMRDGKVAEHWANRDDLSMGEQLGWTPPTPLYLARMLLSRRRARRGDNRRTPVGRFDGDSA